MPVDDARCPGCGQPMTRVADHGVRYTCAACRGRLLGLRPFEQLLQEGVGARAWMGSEAGGPAGPCPFCGNAMRAVPASAGAPDGLAMCRIDEQVWVPASAQPWMTEHAAAATGPAAISAPPNECGECGAPWQPDGMGRCPFCHAQLTAPALAVLIPEDIPHLLR